MTAAAKVSSESPVFKSIAYDATKGHIRLPNGKTYAVSQFAVGKKEIIGAKHPKTLQELSHRQRQAIFKLLDAMVADKEIKRTLTLTKHNEIDFNIQKTETSLVATITGKVFQKKETESKEDSEETEAKETFSKSVEYSGIQTLHETLLTKFSKETSDSDETAATDESEESTATDAEVDTSDDNDSDGDVNTNDKTKAGSSGAANTDAAAKTKAAHGSANGAKANTTPNGKAAAPAATPNGKPASGGAANDVHAASREPLSLVESDLDDESPAKTTPGADTHTPSQANGSNSADHQAGSAKSRGKNLLKELNAAGKRPALVPESDNDGVARSDDDRAESEPDSPVSRLRHTNSQNASADSYHASDEPDTPPASAASTADSKSEKKGPQRPAPTKPPQTPAKPETGPVATPMKRTAEQIAKEKSLADALAEIDAFVKGMETTLEQGKLRKEDSKFFLNQLKLWYPQFDHFKLYDDAYPNSKQAFEKYRANAKELLREYGQDFLALDPKTETSMRLILLTGKVPPKSFSFTRALSSAAQAIKLYTPTGKDDDYDIDNENYQWLIAKLLARCLLFKDNKEINEFKKIQANLCTIEIFRILNEKYTQHHVYYVLKPFCDASVPALSPRKKSVSANAPGAAKSNA